MKTKFALSLLLVGLAVAPLTFSGCANNKPTPEAVAFLSFKSTWTATHAAYAQWCERVVQGKVTAAQEEQADNAWNLFRVTFRTALVEASGNMTAVPPDNLKAQANQVLALTR